MAPDAHERAFGTGTISLLRADITTLDVDAIVNAANSSLAGGGGVDGAVHRAGGAQIMRELRERYDGCPTGSAVITGAGSMSARHGERDLLRSAYRTAFAIAAEHGLTTVAAPSISTGIYGFPITHAAPIAVDEARTALVAPATSLRAITFALFSSGDLAVFSEALSSL